MKKTKIGIIFAVVTITMIITLLVTSTLSIGGGDSPWEALWSSSGPSHYKSYGFALTDGEVARRNNIYCIEHGHELRGRFYY